MVSCTHSSYHLPVRSGKITIELDYLDTSIFIFLKYFSGAVPYITIADKYFFAGVENHLFVGNLGHCPVTERKKIPRALIFQGFAGKWSYSHSMVPVGFGVRSYNTLLMPGTSLVIRLTIFPRSA